MSRYSINNLKEIYYTARDIQEYVYCPRFIYFQYVLRIRTEKTYKMEKGGEVHERFKKSDPELDDSVKIYYDIYLKDEKLGLVAVLDQLQVKEDEAIPVELKTSWRAPEKIADHHLAQVVTQAILVESQMNLLVKKVKVWYMIENKLLTQEISIQDKLKILEILEQIKDIVFTENIPPPTPHESKCVNCEYWCYCLRA
ncbi:MAG: CRISPR-associated protein Cas4 [Candidatus Helarchaeota archaeon]